MVSKPIYVQLRHKINGIDSTLAGPRNPMFLKANSLAAYSLNKPYGFVDYHSIHGVQRRMISVDNFFRFFEIIIFCFVVAICDLVHAVEVTYGLP